MTSSSVCVASAYFMLFGIGGCLQFDFVICLSLWLRLTSCSSASVVACSWTSSFVLVASAYVMLFGISGRLQFDFVFCLWLRLASCSSALVVACSLTSSYAEHGLCPRYDYMALLLVGSHWLPSRDRFQHHALHRHSLLAASLAFREQTKSSKSIF